MKTPAYDTYILHFDRPYWMQCKHYVGYTSVGIDSRVERHRSGRGSLLVNYAHNKKGIPFQLGLVEHFDSKEFARGRETRLKREGHLSRHCSVCQEAQS